MQDPPPPEHSARPLPASRILTATALALAVLALSPLSSDAVTPVDPKETAILPCADKSGTVYKARVSPKRCAHFGPSGEFAGGVNLRRLVWQEWGESKAHGAGLECGFDAGCANLPATVLAYRIRNRCGRPVYTRLRARTGTETTTIKTSGCLGRT